MQTSSGTGGLHEVSPSLTSQVSSCSSGLCSGFIIVGGQPRQPWAPAHLQHRTLVTTHTGLKSITLSVSNLLFVKSSHSLAAVALARSAGKITMDTNVSDVTSLATGLNGLPQCH